jgi:hypothetical protein
MSYIHVAIPVNLTSVQQQINAFHGYLDTFTNLSTSHSNKAHFTRVINELTTFAKSDIVDFSNRLCMLDHILPVDIKPHRHKSFIDMILFRICATKLTELQTEFQQCNATFNKLFNDSAECSTKLNALKTHKIPGLSFITPRQARQNVIATSAVVICELDCKSLYRKLHFCYSNINLATSFLLSCNSNITNLLNHSFAHLATPHFIPVTPPPTTTPSPPTTTDFHFYNIPNHISVHTSGTSPINHDRHKRQIFVAAAAAGAILGTFLGLFNSKEISDIKHDLLKLSDQHNILTSIVNKHEHELASLHTELKSLTDSAELLIMYNPALIYAILHKTVTAMNRRIYILFDTLQQLQHQTLQFHSFLNPNSR